jgi:hypothetical protein
VLCFILFHSYNKNCGKSLAVLLKKIKEFEKIAPCAVYIFWPEPKTIAVAAQKSPSSAVK